MNDRASVTLTSLTISYLIIAIAAAILVAWIAEDWTLFIPSMLLLGGIFATFVGFRQRTGGFDRRRSNDGNFLMFWGTLLVAFGIMWAINSAYPGSAFFLIIGFLVWLGIAVLLFTIRKK
ncbi:MAG: hypothetical protein AB9860_08565 [Methanomassiliicoccales archaeon]